jgi:exosome complex component RRP42
MKALERKIEMESYALELIRQDKRVDERKFEDFREIEIIPNFVNRAEGSAFVRFGNTKVVVGVKMELSTPFSDTPDEGALSVSAEFTPLASPDFEAGPPGEDATELARIVDRGIRESEMIDLKSLCITPGEKVWGVAVDIHIINNDGNLVDCSALASVVAVLTTKIPKLENDKIVHGQFEKPLPVSQKPITITVCKVGDKFLFDPNVQEEEVIDTKLSIAVRDDGKICALQKQGSKGMTVKEVETAVDMAIKKIKDMRKLIKV